MSEAEEDYSFDDFHEDSGEEQEIKPLKPIVKHATSPPKHGKGSPGKLHSPLRGNQRGFNDDDASTVDDNASDGVLSLGPSMKFNDSLKYPDLSRVHARAVHDNESDFDYDEIDEEIDAFGSVRVHENVEPIRAISPLLDIPEQLVLPPMDQPAPSEPPIKSHIEVELIEDKAFAIMSPAAQKEKHIVYDVQDSVSVEVVEEVPESVEEPHTVKPAVTETVNIGVSNDSGKGTFDASKLQNVKMKAANMRKRNGSEDAAEVTTTGTESVPAPVDPIIAEGMSHPVAGKWVPHKKDVVASTASKPSPIKSIVSPLAVRKQLPGYAAVVKNNSTATAAPGRSVQSIKNSIQNELTQLGLDALSPIAKQPNNAMDSPNSVSHNNNGVNKSYSRRVASTGTTTAVTKQPIRAVVSATGTTAATVNSSTSNTTNTANTASATTATAKPYNHKYEQIKKLRSEHANQKPAQPEPANSPSKSNAASSDVSGAVVSPHPTFSNPGTVPHMPHVSHTPAAHSIVTNKYRPSPAEVQSNRRISLKPAIPARKPRPPVVPVTENATMEASSIQPTPVAAEVTNKAAISPVKDTKVVAPATTGVSSGNPPPPIVKKAAIPTVTTNSTLHTVPAPNAVIPAVTTAKSALPTAPLSGVTHMQHRRLRTPDVPHSESATSSTDNTVPHHTQAAVDSTAVAKPVIAKLPIASIPHTHAISSATPTAASTVTKVATSSSNHAPVHSTHRTNTHTSSSSSSTHSNSKITQQQPYQPKPPPNKPSVPRQVHHHPVPAKEQYLPASVLEENSTFSTLLDNSTYSEDNDAEYVLPVHAHDDHKEERTSDNTTVIAAKYGFNKASSSRIDSNSISSSGRSPIKAIVKPNINPSPNKTHGGTNTHHHPHTHVQFKVTEDKYSDHDEEGIPMSAPTAGSQLRQSDYRFPDTSRSATEHNSKHALYHNNPYTNNVPYNRNKRTNNVYGIKNTNKAKKSTFHPSAPAKQLNMNKARPKVLKFKQKSDWMADPSHRYDESTGLFSSYETDVKREARIEQARINAILRKQAQEREAEIARTAYLKRRHEAEMLQQLKDERQLQLQHQKEQRNLEMQQLYGSPPNPHQHSPLPAVHPSYHGPPSSHPASHPVSYVQHSPDFIQESYSVHSSGQSASGGHNGYYSGERSVGSYNRGGNKGNNAYANGNLVNEHHSPYNTPSPVHTKSGPHSYESPHHSPVHHIPTKQVQIALDVEDDDAYSSDPDQNSPDRSAASSPIKGRVSTPKHSPQKVKTEVSHPQGWNNSVNTHSQSKAGYVRKGRNVVEQHADHKNVISTYSKPTAPVSGTNKPGHHSAHNNAAKPVTNAPAHVTTTATIHNVNLNKLFDVSTSSTVVEEHNLNGDSTMSPLYRNNSSTYFSSNNSSVVFNAPEQATDDTAIYDTSYQFNSKSAEKKANLMDPESALSSHNNSFDRIALLSTAASRVKVDLFGDEVDVNIIQNDIHNGLSIADTPPLRRKSSVRTNNNPAEAPEDYYIEKVQSMLGIDLEDMKNIKIHSFYGDNSPRSNTTVASNSSEKQNNLKNCANLAAKGLSLEDAFTYAGELDLPDEGQEQTVTEEIPEQVAKDDGGYDSYGDDDFEDTVEDEVTAGKGYSSPLQQKQQQAHSFEEIEDEVIIDNFAVENALKTLPTVSSLTNSNTSSYAYNSTPNATAATAAVVDDDYEENDYADEAFETVESSRTTTRQRSAKPTATLTSATSSASPNKTVPIPLSVISAPAEPAKPAMLSYESDYEEEFEQEDEPSELNNNNNIAEEYAAPPDLDLSELHPYAFADTVNGGLESVNSTLHSDYNGSLNGSPLLGLRLAPSTDTLRGTSTDLYNNTLGSTDVLDNSLQYSVGSNMHTYSRDKFMPEPSDTGFYISQQNSVYDDFADTTTLHNYNSTNCNVSAEHNNDDSYADDFDNEYEDREGDNNGIMFTIVESSTAADVSVNPVDDTEVLSNTTVPVAHTIMNVGSDDSGDGLTNFLAIDTKVNNNSNADSGAYSPFKHPQPHKHQHNYHHNTSLAIETSEEPAESDTHSPHKHKDHKHNHHKGNKDKHRDLEYDSANNSGNNSGSDSSGPNSPSKHKKHHKHQVDTSESAADGVGIADENSSPSRHKWSPNNSRTNSPSKSKHHKHRDKAEHSDEAIADTVSSVVGKFSTARETIGNHTPTHTKEVYSDDEYSFTPPSHAKRINNNQKQKASVDSKPTAVEPDVNKYEAPTMHSNKYQPTTTTATTDNVRKAKDSSFINTYDDDGLYGDYYFDDTAIGNVKERTTGAELSTINSIGGGYNKTAGPVATPATGTVNPTPYSVRNFSIAITDSATAHNLSNSLTNNKPTTTAAAIAATGGSSKKVDLLARIQLNSMAYMEDDDSEIEDPEPAVSYYNSNNNSNSTIRGNAALDSKPTTTVAAATDLPSINTNKATSLLAPLPVLAMKTNSMTYSSQPAPAMANDNSTNDLDHDVLDLLFDNPTVPTLPVDNAYNSKGLANAAESDIEADEANDNGGGDYFEDEDHLEGDHSLEEESTLSKHSKHSKHKKHKKSKGKHKHKHKHRVTIIGAASEVDDLNHSSSDSGEDGNFEDTDLDFGLENDYSPSTQLPSVSPVRGNNNTAGDLCEELAFSPSKKHNLATPSVEIAKEKKHKHKKHKSKRKHKKHKKSKNRTGETDTLESSLGTLDDLDEEGSGENDSSGDEEDEENLGEEEFDF